MLVVTTPEVAGYRIDAVMGDVLGIAHSYEQGAMRWTGNQGKYLHTAWQNAATRMWQMAEARGANAVVGYQIQACQTQDYHFGLFATGTAVFLTPLGEGEPGATPQSIEDRRRAARGVAPQDVYSSDYKQPPSLQNAQL